MKRKIEVHVRGCADCNKSERQIVQRVTGNAKRDKGIVLSRRDTKIIAQMLWEIDEGVNSERESG